MFTLGRPEFPVDTHVWRIARTRLGWAPADATREQTYEHLNRRIPDDAKYDLHVLLVDHGKRCAACVASKGRVQKESHGDCPLQHASNKKNMVTAKVLGCKEEPQNVTIKQEFEAAEGGLIKARATVKVEPLDTEPELASNDNESEIKELETCSKRTKRGR
jgi:hypothetical protein